MAAVRRPVPVQSPFRRLEELWRRGRAGKLAKREGEAAVRTLSLRCHFPSSRFPFHRAPSPTVVADAIVGGLDSLLTVFHLQTERCRDVAVRV